MHVVSQETQGGTEKHNQYRKADSVVMEIGVDPQEYAGNGANPARQAIQAVGQVERIHHTRHAENGEERRQPSRQQVAEAEEVPQVVESHAADDEKKDRTKHPAQKFHRRVNMINVVDQSRRQSHKGPGYKCQHLPIQLEEDANRGQKSDRYRESPKARNRLAVYLSVIRPVHGPDAKRQT